MKLSLSLLFLVSMLFMSGCSSTNFSAPMQEIAMEANESTEKVEQDRMLIWTADLDIQVNNISNSVAKVTAFITTQKGFVERTMTTKDGSASMTLRVPAKILKSTMSSLETIGTVTRRNISAEDVTEKYVDIDARLKNKIALRDRLKQLLDKATAVKDILSIETELNRVQSDIDSMTAQIKSLKGRADYATIDLTLSRKQILGPLGYLFKGLYWGIEKLFIIQE